MTSGMAMAAIETKGEQNTFDLPDGPEIESEVIAILEDQRRALFTWMDKEGVKGILPPSWPSLQSLGYGAASIARRLGRSMKSTYDAATRRFSPGDRSLLQALASIADELQSAAMRAASSLNATTQAALDRLLTLAQDAVRKGRALGETIAQLREDTTKFFDSAASRAERLAITEASRAYHYVQHEMAVRFDPELIGWRWKTAAGACDLCLEIESQAPIVRQGQPFAVIGTGDYAEIFYPPAHPRCRCSVEAVRVGDQVEEWGSTVTRPDRPAVMSTIRKLSPSHPLASPRRLAEVKRIRR